MRTLSFVTLSSSALAYTVSILPMAKCSTCKAAPPLPKNLAPLRFSGALFFPRSRMGLILSFRPRRAASPPSGEILRASVSVTNAFPFLPSPILRGKGDRLRWMRVVPSSLLAAPPKIRSVSPHQALCASFPPLGGKPCVEPCSERLFRSRQDPSTRFARSG